MKALGVLAMATTLAAASIPLRDSAATTAAASRTYEDVYYLPPTEWLPTMTLGYREAAADLLWSRALLYYADQIQHRAEGANAIRYARDITALDPYFRPAYTWAGFIPFYLASGQADTSLMRAGIEAMAEGIRYFPNDGEMAWDLASTIRYEFLPHFDGPDDERRRWERVAARHMARAWRLGAAPDWVTISDDDLANSLGERERRLAHLRELLAITRDPEVRSRAMTQLAQLEDLADFQAEMALREHFTTAHEQQYPYLSADHFSVIGPRELPFAE